MKPLSFKAISVVDDTGLEKGLLFFTIFHERKKPLIFLRFLPPILHHRALLNIHFHGNNDQITTPPKKKKK